MVFGVGSRRTWSWDGLSGGLSGTARRLGVGCRVILGWALAARRRLATGGDHDDRAQLLAAAARRQEGSMWL